MTPRHYAALLTTLAAQVAFAQTTAAGDDRTRILAVVDSALAAINRTGTVPFGELMIDEGIMVPVSARSGTLQHSIRNKVTESTRPTRADIIERGFKPEVRIAAGVAMVWLPYDLYIAGTWSHCGIDAFTLVKSGGAWKIASIAWSVEQPPACEKHPDGPPRR